MASFDAQGSAVASPIFPWNLRFQPSGEVEFPSTVADGYTDYTEQLASIPLATNLWDIYAMDKPVELGGTEMKIGQMILNSQLTTSNWGDEHMYFRHERMEDDLALRPEWEPYTPHFDGIFGNLAQESNNSDCPFANILAYLQ